MHLHAVGLVAYARNRRDVADKIVIELLVERRVYGVRYVHQEERIAIGRRVHYGFGGDIAAGAWTVLNDELLAEPFGQPMRQQAPRDVGCTASGETDDKVG
jgi:hypothetical protein